MTNNSLPNCWLFTDEFLHQPSTFLIVENDYFDPSLLEVFLSANERLVLSNHDSPDLVHDAGTGAHVAR